jgi:hypothetical protein
MIKFVDNKVKNELSLKFENAHLHTHTLVCEFIFVIKAT